MSTVYHDPPGDHLNNTTTYRGKNAFGAVVTNTVMAIADMSGNVLDMRSLRFDRPSVGPWGRMPAGAEGHTRGLTPLSVRDQRVAAPSGQRGNRNARVGECGAHRAASAPV